VRRMTQSVRMPGFTAEVSLGPASTSYSSSRHRSEQLSGAAVVLQFRRPFGGKTAPCDPNCLCITPEGCSCCYDATPEIFLTPGR
jgi:hypothetical protein